MAVRDRSHILLRGWARAEAYTSHGSGGSGHEVPERDPGLQGAALRRSFEEAVQEGLSRRARVSVEVDEKASGLLLDFESFPGIELALPSLENHRLKRPIELRAVNATHIGPDDVQRAVVFVPDEARGAFLRKLERYVAEQTPKGTPKHRDLFDRLADIRLATLESFWTEATLPFPPVGERIWWEVWLRRDEGREVERFVRFATAVGTEVPDRRLAFDDRTVVLSRATPRQLAESLDVLDDLAEVRQARVLAGFFETLEPREQADWIEELLRRASFSRDRGAPAVCILDTGVRAGHPLLQPAIDAADLHSVDPAWGTADHKGHGTEMAGLALYGCTLADCLADSEPLVIPHLLESVKILPPPPRTNDPELYGAITAEAVGWKSKRQTAVEHSRWP